MSCRNAHGQPGPHSGYRWFRKLSPYLRSLVTESQTVDLITTEAFPIWRGHCLLIKKERSLPRAAENDVETIGRESFGVERVIAVSEQTPAEHDGYAVKHRVVAQVGRAGKKDGGHQAARQSDTKHRAV